MGQHAVNIVYPISGDTIPKIDAKCDSIRSAYFVASFSVTCGGGPHKVKWGFDATARGNATFYDQFSAQFTWKLPGGSHTFWVESDCGSNKIEFKIG
jgi:hypothetical protein